MYGCLDETLRWLGSTLTFGVIWVTTLSDCLLIGDGVMPSKLERLLEKEAQLKAQIQQAKAAERTLEKKRDTRRKILIGAAVMARVNSGEWPKADLRMMMDGFLTRPHERALFDLDASQENTNAEPKAASDEKKKAADGEGKTADKPKAKTKKLSKSRAKLAEPDFDVDKEFNL